MTISFAFLAAISIIFGVLFFIVAFYERKHPKLDISLIAGISIAYFFLVLLPEIAENIPQFPLGLKLFEYLFVVIGFVFVHVSEKLILQKVESKSQKRMRKLIVKEETLEEVERNIEKILTRELEHEDLDTIALKDIAQTISALNEQEQEFKTKINRYKSKIQKHINEELAKLRFFTNFTYHFLVGIIVVGLLAINLITGILFFLFAWFRAIITNRSESHLIFTDLEIYETCSYEDNITKKYILAFANLIGIFIGIIIGIVARKTTNIEGECLELMKKIEKMEKEGK